MASGLRRTFDYAEACRLHEQGIPVFWIAHRLGVSVWSVRRAIRPERREYERRWYEERTRRVTDALA